MAQPLFGPLLIRADGNARIGLGHVMRCLALGQAWQDRCGEVIFVTTQPPPALAQRIGQERFVMLTQPHAEGSMEDAQATVAMAREHGARCLVVDGYHFSAAFRQALRDAEAPLLAIDDLGDSDLSQADLILNQNAYASPALYAKAAPGKNLLLGARHALLRREFLKITRAAGSAQTASRVLITMGGSDAPNVTQRLMEIFIDLPQPRLRLDIVVGSANPHVEKLRALLPALQARHATELLVNPARLGEVMAGADLAVSAAGSSCWELAYLGLPMALVVTAENQRGVAAFLEQAGVAEILGHHDTFPAGDIGARLTALLGDRERRAEMAALARRLVDGHGAGRVAERLACFPISIRAATQADVRLLFEWVNDPAVRASAFNSGPITWESHEAWFARRLADAQCGIFIGEDESGAPVGQVRLEDDEGTAVVDVSVAGAHRGRGFAPKLLRLAVAEWFEQPGRQEVRAWIKTANKASQQAFERAGFRRGDEEIVHGNPAVGYRFERP